MDCNRAKWKGTEIELDLTGKSVRAVLHELHGNGTSAHQVEDNHEIGEWAAMELNTEYSTVQKYTHLAGNLSVPWPCDGPTLILIVIIFVIVYCSN